jgi:hypothetical protein
MSDRVFRVSWVSARREGYMALKQRLGDTLGGKEGVELSGHAVLSN